MPEQSAADDLANHCNRVDVDVPPHGLFQRLGVGRIHGSDACVDGRVE